LEGKAAISCIEGRYKGELPAFGRPQSAFSRKGNLVATLLSRPESDYLVMSRNSESNLAVWELDEGDQLRCLSRTSFSTESDMPHLCNGDLCFIEDDAIAIVLSGSVKVFVREGSEFLLRNEIEIDARNILEAEYAGNGKVLVFHFDDKRVVRVSTYGVSASIDKSKKKH
jgi:hypothetical protein